jgi:hypothetical protein
LIALINRPPRTEPVAELGRTERAAVTGTDLDRRPGTVGENHEHRHFLQADDERTVGLVGKADANVALLEPPAADLLRTLQDYLRVVTRVSVGLDTAVRRKLDLEHSR